MDQNQLDYIMINVQYVASRATHHTIPERCYNHD